MTAPKDDLAALRDFPVFCETALGLDLSSRQGHVAIARASDGLPLSAEELVFFRTFTGRDQPRPEGYPYLLEVVGRQSGKTEQAAARIAHAGTMASVAGTRDVA